MELTQKDWEALNTDYASGEVDRENAKRYVVVHRGSVRLIRDLYRTEAEHRAYIERGRKLRLHGQKTK